MEASTIPELVDAAAERFGDQEAVVDGDLRWSFSEYRDEAHGVAGALIRRGIQPGDRVAVWAPNSARWAATALGIHCAGGVLVPLNTRLGGRDIAGLLERTSVRLLFTVTDFRDTDYVTMLAGAGGADTLEETVVMSGPTPDVCTPWKTFIAGADRPDPSERTGSVSADDLCHILFTSGTTGTPKGAMLRHGAVCRSYREWGAAIGLREGDRYLAVSPFFHTFGLNGGILACLMSGTTLVPEAVFDPQAVTERVAEESITVLPGPPTVYRSLLDHIDGLPLPTSTLRLAVTGAAPVSADLVGDMHDLLGFETVLTGYGLTEASGVSTTCRHDDPPILASTSSGRALPGIDLKVVGDSGLTMPTGEPGQVLLRGYNVMAGYLDDEAGTTEAVDTDGWLQTGDTGFVDDAGNLTVTGRSTDMYICGGFNVYPAEVEAVLAAHPDIDQVVVVGAPDDRMGEVGMAFVVPTAGRHVGPSAVLSWAREELASHMAPRHVEVVESLPTNPGGKVLRYQLRQVAAQITDG
ncbi:MAG: fatty acid--CoA ligase [Acidimicrobiaceae bacterium]|nr:fatty acid--CoA ligase [Acidimicrobiaceae bacterium]MDP6480679.1 AMP-binding protein [Acidimicrobiales bacterium]MDP6696203.1 AMP-binding protein [Acidimicrobiales bacterium]